MAQVRADLVDVYVFRRVGAAVEFLQLLRSGDRPLSRTWQAVHGRIEAGETAAAAGLRELMEECGVRPLRFWQLERVNVFFVARLDSVMCCPGFAAEIAADAPLTLSSEHTAWRWLDAQTALTGFMWPGQRDAVREITEEIVTPGPGEEHLRIALDGV